MFKCRNCGFICSEPLPECPICEDCDFVSTFMIDPDDTCFVITTEDVENVIENMDDKYKKQIEQYPIEVIMDVLQRKLIIDWDEDIEACLKARLCK